MFYDSLPGAWGRLLLDKKLQKSGIAYGELSPLSRLSLVGSNSFGALEYEPAEAGCSEDGQLSVHLDDLACDADALLEGHPCRMLDGLAELSGAAGGAQPKIAALVSDDKRKIVHGKLSTLDGFSPWLIKLSNRTDRRESGLQEYVCSVLARKAGIVMPETHLFPSKLGCGHFGVKRFDRTGKGKVHIHSACGLLHADNGLQSLDYAALLKLTQVLTKNYQDVEQMVRLMIFNVKAGNKDDHSKNFSFMLDESNKWKLAPAYDLTKSGGINGGQTAMVNGKGVNITDDDLLAEALRIGVSARKTREMIEEVSSCLAEYDAVMKEAERTVSAEVQG